MLSGSVLTAPAIKAKTSELGFDLCGIATAVNFPELAFLREWFDLLPLTLDMDMIRP